MDYRSRNLMRFPLPLPVFCRGVGKWKREASVARRVCRVWFRLVRWGLVDCRRAVRRRPHARWSVAGEAVTVGGFDDETGGGHGREARVEGGGTDAAGCPQFGERPWLLAVHEGGGDTVIDGVRLERSVGLAIGLNRLEGKSAVALDQFERDAWHGGSGTML